MSLGYVIEGVSGGFAVFIHSKTHGQTHHISVYNGSSANKSTYIDDECGDACCYLAIHNVTNNITTSIAKRISRCLKTCDILLEYQMEINVQASIEWNSHHSLTLRSRNDITLTQGISIRNNGNGILRLMSGMENPTGNGTVVFEEGSSVSAPNGGRVEIYYNPEKGELEHKYLNPQSYFRHIGPMAALTSFMLVNNVDDLQSISCFLSGNYALSQNINASITKDSGHEFHPLYLEERNMPFSGNFNGNDFTLAHLHVKATKYAGIFGVVSGSARHASKISNLKLQDVFVKGTDHVGILAGDAEYVTFENIKFISGNIVEADTVAGAILGSGSGVNLDIAYDVLPEVRASEYVGTFAGALRNSHISIEECCIAGQIKNACVGLILESDCN